MLSRVWYRNRGPRISPQRVELLRPLGRDAPGFKGRHCPLAEHRWFVRRSQLVEVSRGIGYGKYLWPELGRLRLTKAVSDVAISQDVDRIGSVVF
jgi:hypothetical protein